MYRVNPFALLLLFSIAGTADAQLVQSFGVKVGGNASTVMGSKYDVERRTGIHASVFAELLNFSNISVIAEFEYSRRGFISREEIPGPNDKLLRMQDATTTLDYLSTPVLARVRYPLELGVTPYAIVGPRLDVLVRRDPGSFEFSTIQPFSAGVSKDFEDVSLAASIGIGAAFHRLLGREIRVEARYSIGFTDLHQARFFDIDVRNSWYDISVGAAF